MLGAPWYQERLTALAAPLERDPDSVHTEAAGYVWEMATSLDERSVQARRSFGRWYMRA